MHWIVGAVDDSINQPTGHHDGARYQQELTHKLYNTCDGDGQSTTVREVRSHSVHGDIHTLPALVLVRFITRDELSPHSPQSWA